MERVFDEVGGSQTWNQTEKTSFMAIVVNKPIPEFDANATGGLKVSNTSHLGHVLVMYFYPNDPDKQEQNAQASFCL